MSVRDGILVTKSPFGKPSVEIRAADAAAYGAKPQTTKCLFCRWQHVGTADQGRDAAAAHRADRHPDVVQTRRRRGHLNRWNISDPSWQEEGNAQAAEVAAMLKRREAAA